jgi:hypothetical protein
VSVFGDARAYDAARAEKLAQDAHARLAFLSGKRLNVLSRRIEIRPPQARVELRLLGREGMGHVRYVLAKHGERWLIGEVDVGR